MYNQGCDERENTLGIRVNMVNFVCVEQLRERMKYCVVKEIFFK